MRDLAFQVVTATVNAMGIEAVLTAPRSPWQNIAKTAFDVLFDASPDQAMHRSGVDAGRASQFTAASLSPANARCPGSIS
jgi:hypothetical protein